MAPSLSRLTVAMFSLTLVLAFASVSKAQEGPGEGPRREVFEDDIAYQHTVCGETFTVEQYDRIMVFSGDGHFRIQYFTKGEGVSEEGSRYVRTAVVTEIHHQASPEDADGIIHIVWPERIHTTGPDGIFYFEEQSVFHVHIDDDGQVYDVIVDHSRVELEECA